MTQGTRWQVTTWDEISDERETHEITTKQGATPSDIARATARATGSDIDPENPEDMGNGWETDRTKEKKTKTGGRQVTIWLESDRGHEAKITAREISWCEVNTRVIVGGQVAIAK